MINYNLIFSVFVALSCFFCSSLMLFKIKDFLRIKILDKPNKRSSHTQPTPSGGGVSFVLFGSIGNLLLGNNIAIICLPLAFIGFLDDIKGFPAALRYFTQIITVLFLLAFSSFDKLIRLNFAGFNYFIIFLFVLILSSGIINFCNFIDGLDGLLISCILVVFFSFLLMGDLTILPVIGSCLGFLIWNWSPAKIFMGDIGSTFLGSLYVGYIFQSSTFSIALAKLLLLTPILADCIFCIFRRFLIGHNIFKAHKLHLYQRLNQAGWNHAKVTIIYSSSILVLLLSYILLGLQGLILFSIFTLISGFYLDKYYAIDFS